ncbi:MAG: D-alanyl-D-alanine carboxypeptidase family protein [Erysipelotrichaceae bacterium]|nr:D-alanyl-D-alanine carboxypeptidase family protein [Erysipelotrichaceae bacterium]
MKHCTVKNDIMADMENRQTRGIRIWTAVFVFSVALLGMVCLAVLNSKYDSLSRYPYTDKKSRELIKEYLTSDEIDYIIEYSIAPNVFIAFIQEDGFNIYNAAEYKRLSQYQWDQPPGQIVRMIEDTREVMDTDTLILLLSQYSYDEIKDYLDNGDPYKQDSVLVMNPASLDAWVDASHTIVRRVPWKLQALSENVPSDHVILIEEEAREPLENMCRGIRGMLGSDQACAGLIITDGYVSYDEQKTRYEQAEDTYGKDALQYELYPGHCERQLGLTVDFRVDGIPQNAFEKTLQNLWLEENAYKYGFVCTWDRNSEEATGIVPQPWHYRYVGVELAKLLHSSNQTFADYIASASR